jgi:ParB-like chromosome segregation protein Spo0J
LRPIRPAGEGQPPADVDEIVSATAWADSHPVSTVRIDSLVVADSPRLAGENPEHIRLLAEADDVLPPITVHRPTRRVIDGVHRVRAALLNGSTHIEARLLDCDENAAFLLAVTANVTHGLPLSRADRAAAAARIMSQHPHWSDRAVAEVTGLSGKTVSKIRHRSAELPPRPGTRLGRDGRRRPLDSGPMRRQAATMINERPEVGLREVARATGLSAATVHDVRQRILRGEDPVPERYRPEDRLQALNSPAPPAEEQPDAGQPSQSVAGPASRDALLAQLRADPALASDETGQYALRWLHHHTVDTEGRERLVRGLPDHWAPVIADLARTCASAWVGLAEQLERAAR